MKKIIFLMVTALCWCVFPAQAIESAPAPDNQYFVLAYHNIIDGTEPATPDGKYLPQTVRLETLTNQLNRLQANAYVPISYQDILDARAGKRKLPPKAVLLTFDDGYASFYRLVFPLLKLYQFPAVLAVVGSWMDVPANGQVSYGGGTNTLPRDFFLTWAQVKEVSNSGLVEVASHSYDLHHSEQANSLGSMQPAALTPIWANGAYETAPAFHARIGADLRKSATQIQQYTGIAPRIIV